MIELEERYLQAQETISALRAEVEALKAQVAGEPLQALSWLQMKAHRQRRALDRLNRRVVGQRFQLRTLIELGRGLSREEWLAAKATAVAETPERLTRLDDDLLVV